METALPVTCLFSFSILLCESYHHRVETATVVQTAEKNLLEKASSVNADLAGLIQRLHLQELFRRYGENNTLTIEGFRKLLQNIGIDKMKRIKVDHDHDHHLHHNHVASSKNSERTVCPNHDHDAHRVPVTSHLQELHKVEHVEHEQNSLHSKNTCSNASKLMQSHGIGTQAWLTATEFSYLCPAIINQIDGKYCIVHATSEKAETPPKGYSLTCLDATLCPVFLSLLGVILVPLMNRVFFKFLLSFLVALAVGTLSGDAFLHLLPHQNKGSLFKHLVFQSTEESAYLDSTWKGLTALGGLYFMFLVEHLITLIKQFKDKKKKVEKLCFESLLYCMIFFNTVPKTRTLCVYVCI
uniref:Zinc transporter ZIP6 n=1 Tax=Nothoprocta perdicaria TaxID=30464 RepID=A0A8C6ZLZ6_NOTPE